jgi:hypothetical protein
MKTLSELKYKIDVPIIWIIEISMEFFFFFCELDKHGIQMVLWEPVATETNNISISLAE